MHIKIVDSSLCTEYLTILCNIASALLHYVWTSGVHFSASHIVWLQGTITIFSVFPGQAFAQHDSNGHFVPVVLLLVIR